MARKNLPNDETDASFQLAIALAQRVELKLAFDDADPRAYDDDWTADQKFTTMRHVEFGPAHPRLRTDHGQKRMYTFAAPDIDLMCTLTCTGDLLKELIIRGTRNNAGILKIYPYKLNIKNNVTGAGSGSTELEMNSYLESYRVIKPEGEGHQTVDLQCGFLIGNHEAVTVA